MTLSLIIVENALVGEGTLGATTAFSLSLIPLTGVSRGSIALREQGEALPWAEEGIDIIIVK
jgi:hypothetical protein